jgi:hypothetical protein
MPHAIIRGANGRRHEVDFGDPPVRVEIHASEETVEVFVEADFRRGVGASPFAAVTATCLMKPLAQQPECCKAKSPSALSGFDRRDRSLAH